MASVAGSKTELLPWRESAPLIGRIECRVECRVGQKSEEAIYHSTSDQGTNYRWEPAGSGGEAAGSGEMARHQRRRQYGAAGENFSKYRYVTLIISQFSLHFS